MWFGSRGHLTPLAFDADRHIIARYARCLNTGWEMTGLELPDTQSWFSQV